MLVRTLRRPLRAMVRSRTWRRVGAWVRGGTRRRNPAGHEIDGIDVPADVVVYFGDAAAKRYQLDQWLPVLEELHQRHRVLLICRKLAAQRSLRGRTTLPRIFVRRFADLMALYDANDYLLTIYVNNSVSNFQSLSHSQPVHVHVNHGESDKVSMVSNQAKAYDRVFIAGEAALQRHRKALIDFDESRLVMVGRPQLDQHPEPTLFGTAEQTVMYAPTWEGENEANNYTSVDLYGVQIVQALLARDRVRVVYRPHPRVAGSANPALAAAHLQIVADLEQANEQGGEHVISVEGDILAMLGAVDALVTDVSSVGLDFLYLHPDRPLIVADRRSDPAALAESSPLTTGCQVLDASNLDSLDALLTAAIDDDRHREARSAMRHHYFGDHPAGSSTQRFTEAVESLIDDRRAKLTRHTQHASAMEADDLIDDAG